ncbi:protein ENHANCED DOWNY MILDEW 2-like isoform X2 [Camellia sinensis]|uniref:protein ENHANCED DOWNY MILDEW 2-like isoform X2 n=1 Tax=Camellia sinensis TaxID=4442 RepID=UPI00103598C2|nr:protein ENHANCED DOWNY MILDEW 2-like isoform X2 [Camellia sinensis]
MIVDVLHFYVQDGDMKLDKTGTRCSYKNYDVLQAKNDFNFEDRDWMTVHPKEFPTGSQLVRIMFLLFNMLDLEILGL